MTVSELLHFVRMHSCLFPEFTWMSQAARVTCLLVQRMIHC